MRFLVMARVAGGGTSSVRRATAALLLLLLVSAGCHICSPDGERRCDEGTLKVCRDGDLLPLQCADGGVSTTCRQSSDGGAEC
jgi:hypothetical protein